MGEVASIFLVTLHFTATSGEMFLYQTKRESDELDSESVANFQLSIMAVKNTVFKIMNSISDI